VEGQQNFLESYKNAEKIGVLENKVSRRSFLFAGLLSVIGVTSAGSYFFPQNSRAQAASGVSNLRGSGSFDIGSNDYTVDTTSDLSLKDKGVPTSGAVKSFIEKKILDTIKETFSKDGLPANFVKISDTSLSFKATTVQQAIEIIDGRVEVLEQDSHKAVTAADGSITVDVPNQTIKVNPSGILFNATINGGNITNLQDFLNISTATLNTITALGGVNEGVNEGQGTYLNRADLFNRKDGTKFYFRTLVSGDNSVTFTEAGDGKTIDLKVNVQNNSVTTTQIVDNSITTNKLADNSVTTNKIVDNSITTNKILDGNVTLAKLADIKAQRLLGNSSAVIGPVNEIALDTNSLFFNGSGNLAVRTGLGGLNLTALDGDLTLNQIQNLNGKTLIGNSNVGAASPQELTLNPTYFDFIGSQLTLNTSFVSGVTTPFLTQVGRVKQVTNTNPVDIGINASATPGTPLNVFGNGPLFSLLGTDHSYIQFYPQGFAAGRKAYLGFGTAGTANLTLANENTGNLILKSGTSGGTSEIIIADGQNLVLQALVGVGNTDSGDLVFREGQGAGNGTEKARIYTGSGTGTNDLYFRTTPTNNPSIYVNGTGLVGVGFAPTTGYQLSVLGSTRLYGGGVTAGSGASGNPADGSISLGDINVDYFPTNANWSTTGSTLLLSAANYSTIGFHDAGSRVDFIRTGAATMTLGYDGGFGSPYVFIPNRARIAGGTDTSAPQESLVVPGKVFTDSLRLSVNPAIGHGDGDVWYDGNNFAAVNNGNTFLVGGLVTTAGGVTMTGGSVVTLFNYNTSGLLGGAKTFHLRSHGQLTFSDPLDIRLDIGGNSILFRKSKGGAGGGSAGDGLNYVDTGGASGGANSIARFDMGSGANDIYVIDIYFIVNPGGITGYMQVSAQIVGTDPEGNNPQVASSIYTFNAGGPGNNQILLRAANPTGGHDHVQFFATLSQNV
jgi:hypothetical protein